MSVSLFGLGKAVCDTTAQLGIHTLSQSACYRPTEFGTAISIVLFAAVTWLAYQYWRVSAP